MNIEDKILFRDDSNIEDSNHEVNDFRGHYMTTSPKEKEFCVKYRNPYIHCLMSGAFLLSTPTEGKENIISKIPIIESTSHSWVIENYNQEITGNFISYLDEVNSLCLNTNYTKHDVIQEILSFKSLENNWDGYGAIPAEIESATNVITLIDLIGEIQFCKVNDIFSNPNGTISLIWKNRLEEIISLEVGNESMSYYVEYLSKEPEFFDDIEINKREALKISEYIQIL